MKDETKVWLKYSEENLQSAKILLKNRLFNPCLQNVQQCVEKSLKAILIEKSVSQKKTHDILELKILLDEFSVKVDIKDEECDFLNSIYLPSKYPIGSALPDFDPGVEICEQAIAIAIKVSKSVHNIFKNNTS